MANSEEEMYAKLTVNFITEIFKTAWKSLPDLKNWIEGKNNEHDFFGTKTKVYTKKLEERYNSIKVLGMEKPAPLRKMLVWVNILEKITERQSKTIKELARFFDYDKRGFGHTKETKEGSKVVNELNKFIVLGKPGAGKTTYLKSLLLQTLDGKTEEKRIPVFITLKDFADSGQSLLEFMIKQFDICHFPEAAPFIIRILENGEFQVLLDGLDEVSKENEHKVIGKIIDFSDKYSENQFVVSCRIAAYNYRFDKFTDIEVADFNDEQIQNFIGKWFLGKPQSAEKCWNELEENEQIRELASTPLLLVLLCLAYEENLAFPQNRSQLYNDAIQALLKKWDTSRGIQRQEIYHGLSSNRKLSMFSRIAAETFEKGEYFIKQGKLEKLILNYIQNLPGVTQETLPEDSEAVLKAIEAQHGIFVQRAKGIYSFSHLTFQEYFTARHIVENAAHGTLKNLINKHLLEDKWREVFLLTTGMLDEADTFLLGIKAKIDTLLQDQKLDQVLREIYSVIKETSYYSVHFKREFAIYYILARALHGDSDIDLARALDRRRDPDIDHAVSRAFARDFARDPDLVLDIELDIGLARALGIELDIGLVHARALAVYLQANQLLVDCLSTECYVTKENRQKIMDTLLALPEEKNEA